MNINGKFHALSDTKKAPLIVGLIGDAHTSRLTEKNIEYIKAFYLRSGHTHEFLNDYNVNIIRTLYTSFIKIN